MHLFLRPWFGLAGSRCLFIVSARHYAMILVTGGTGRIGKALIAKLLENGEKVRALVRDEKRAMFLPKGVEPFYGDITKKETLSGALAGVGSVVHLAALVDYKAEYEEMEKVNVLGTKNLLEACPNNLKRFVYGSSISVYGNRLERVPADEETSCSPSSNYGKSKLAAEKVALSYSKKVPLIVLRFAVAYGRGFDEAYIPLLGALDKGKFPILGDGKNRIHFVHVNDAVNAIMLALETGVPSGSTYNIAGPEALTQRETFALACRHLEVEMPKSTTPVWLVRLRVWLDETLSALQGRKQKIIAEHIDTLVSDREFSIEKARKELGFEPKVKLDDGIREMVAYYRSGAYAKS